MSRSITFPITLFSICISLLISQALFAAPQLQTNYVLVYDLDYGNVPDLSSREITLALDVGSINGANVTADGVAVPHTYDANSGRLIFTVDQSPVVVELSGVNTNNIGNIEKVALKDNKEWAWSVGFDDNFFLKPTVSMMESYGYRGTLYQVAKDISDTRNEDWVIDKPDMITYLNNGWSLGSHTWDHNCYQSGDRSATILDGYNRIAQIVAESNRPDYKITGFAAPCFDSDYHPYILNMRDAGQTAVQFNESGSEFPLLVDSGQMDNRTISGKYVYGFNFDRPIGRDARLEFDPSGSIAEIDWVASQASSSHHFWYNSLAKGGHVNEVEQVVAHVHNTYGAGGSNEVWVAPSDHIYSYLLVRENATVTLVDSYQDTAPTEPTNTPTNVPPTNTPTDVPPTNTPTDVPPTNTPTDVPANTPTNVPPTNTPTNVPPTNTPTNIPANTPTNTPPPPSGQPSIPMIGLMNTSGVSAYEIGIFGSGFGANQGSGSVQILNTNSQIIEWTDGFIRAVVPYVAAGDGQLTVTTRSGHQDSRPFTVYTIDPRFQQEPSRRFTNIAEGKTAYLSNVNSSFCYGQPTNNSRTPEAFVFDYTCGYQGVTNVGNVTFNSPATIAHQSDSPLNGQLYVQFFTESSWYTYFAVPQNYQIQVSNDSSNGINGNWTTLETISNNNRPTRLHRVNIPNDNHRWIRINVTAGSGHDSQFNLREVRIYQPTGSGAANSDSFALYGDSITSGAFEAIGPTGFATKVKQMRDSADDLILTVYGLSGQNAYGLVDSSNENDIYDAFATDNMATHALYWGIGLGTNDTLDSSSLIGQSGSNIEEFDNRLDAIVQELLSRNRIPIVARIPETIEYLGGYGSFHTKQKVLNDIDTIAARYRLIPGPDLYTLFRRNAESQNGSYFGNDGMHHTELGEQALLEAWADAFVTGLTVDDTQLAVPTSTPVAPTSTPIPPTSTPANAPTATPTNAPAATNTPQPPSGPPAIPSIDLANGSGVSGYEIGIFGSGFGNSQGAGSVRIRNVDSQIIEWTDGFIKAVVPSVNAGSGELMVTTWSGHQASESFTVYTIDPAFQAQPSSRFVNIAQGATAYLSNVASSFCYGQPTNAGRTPDAFLFDYTCGYQGVTNVGKATFNTPATIAHQSSSQLSGDLYVQFFTESSWYTFYAVPKNYQIEVSSNSTDGINGSWTTIATISNNNRSTRLHRVTVPSGGNRWIRINVSAGTGNNGQFDLKEVRIYQPIGSSASLNDAFALYGDSLTASAFEAIGSTGLAAKVKHLRGSTNDLIFASYGLSGQNSTGLLDSDSDVDIYDALTIDNMSAHAAYWGIALGTNDSQDGASYIGASGANVEEFDNRLEAIVQELISRNRIPIVARIPETLESIGGYGDLPAKKKILGDIDRIAAQYRLIPGPDLYMLFRRNQETQGGSYFGNDGTHHTDVGEQALIQQWANAFVAGTEGEPISSAHLSAPLTTTEGGVSDGREAGDTIERSANDVFLPFVGIGTD